ncbi:MAG TPA: VWA domain-containing protein [Rugosimonospora sp.]|nr:VWA domain-containing protein [Rugosimonospora sp.]
MADRPGEAPLPDLPGVAARFAAALRAAGVPVGADRAERFARAVALVDPATVASLRACAHATLSAGHEHDPVLDAVFDIVFAGYADPADSRGDPNAPPLSGPPAAASGAATPAQRSGGGPAQPSPGSASATGDRTGTGGQVIQVAGVASELERLRHREFSEISAAELADLAEVMAALRLATPARRTRRSRTDPAGTRVDMRASLRLAHRSGGDPVHLLRRRRRERPRPLVVLCDISASMEPYARAMLQLLYCASGANRAEVFVFATRLTRLTPVLRRARPAVALAAAGAAAPDWSGGTRIGAAVDEFLDRYGRRGMARGAVVLVISDGWETGDPGQLGRAMARLSRLAYRIVWVNPRTQSPRYRPLVGGMAAAWPYCDAVVSAHRVDALGELIAALAAPHRTRSRD